jgi:MFS family permease
MANATSNLEILVKLRDEASAQMQKMAGVFKKSWQDSVDASQTFATALGVAGAAAGGYIATATLTAARTETLGVAMNAIAKATGTSTAILNEQEKALKKQGITTQEARGILTLFMQSQLDVADATKIARVAQDMAVISGQNSSQAARTLTEAIASQEPMLLRQFGIVSNLPAIYEKYGKELGLVTEKTDKSGKVSASWARELTDIEKKQAMINLILGEGAKVTGSYEAAMGTAGKKMSSLTRYFEEAANSVGTIFLPVFGQLIDKLTEFLKQITPENIEQWKNKLIECKDPIIIVAGAMTAMLIPAAISAAAAFVSMAVALAPFALAGGALMALIIGIKEGNVALTAIAGAILGIFIPSIIAMTTALYGAVVAAIPVIAAFVIAFWPFILGGAVVAGIAAGVVFIVQNWETLKTKGTEIFGAFTKYLKETWDGIGIIIKETINGIISGINSMISAINGIKISVPKVEYWPGKFFGGWSVAFPQIPSIPLLAAGGIVNSPTLAMIGEAGPEAVVPLNRGGYGSTYNVYIQGGTYLDRQAAEKMGDLIISKLKLQLRM